MMMLEPENKGVQCFHLDYNCLSKLLKVLESFFLSIGWLEGDTLFHFNGRMTHGTCVK